MGDADLVWVRSYSREGRDMLALTRGTNTAHCLTAADVREILGDVPPVIAYDDSGPGGAIIFPWTSHSINLVNTLRDQLNDIIRRKSVAPPCPAEAFPEPAAPAATDADDFAEPPEGEGARVAHEEAAWEAQLRAAAQPKPAPDSDPDGPTFGRWRPGDRFVVNDRDDAARFFAASHLWPTWGGLVRGRVISRCDIHVSGHEVTAGLLIECEGLRRPTAVTARLLSACARRVAHGD